MNEFTRIKKTWARHGLEGWWGDSIDVRFYLMTQIKKLTHVRVLDVGCGKGITLSELDSSNRKHGFDLNSEALLTARHINPTASLLTCSLFERFPYQDNSFDVVIMANVMPYYEISCPHLSQEEQTAHVFNEVRRVLCSEGTLFLTTPNGEYFGYRHLRRISWKKLQESLRGFSSIKIGGWNPFPSLVFFLPDNLKRRIPQKLNKYLYVPSPLLAKIPYMMKLLELCMAKTSLFKGMKAFYVECKNSGEA